MGRPTKIYTPEKIERILNALIEQKKPWAEIAEAENLTIIALKKSITIFRQSGVIYKGKPVPYLRRVRKAGDLIVTLHKGAEYEAVWDGQKYKKTKRITPYFRDRVKVEKKKPVKKKAQKEQKIMGCTKPAARQPTRLPTKVVDPNTTKSVRIDPRTVIQVNKDIPDQLAIDNYYAKRAASVANVNR